MSESNINEYDVIYVHPYFGEEQERKAVYPLLPVGVVGILNLLKDNGVRVRAVNCPIEMMLEPAFSLEGWLRSNSAPTFMIDIHWYIHIAGAISVAREIKRVYPDAQVIVGGTTATVFSKEILEKHPEIDFILVGDGEVPAPILVKELMSDTPNLSVVPNLVYRNNGEVVQSPAPRFVASDINYLNYIDIDFLEHSDQYYYTSISKWVDLKTLWVPLARGCAYNCFHCGASRSSGKQIYGWKGLVIRDPEVVANDLETLHKRGVQNVCITHDFLHLGRTYWLSLFHEIQRRGFKIGVMQPFWQSLPDEEFVEEFVKTFDIENSYVGISIESATEELRKLLHAHGFYSNQRFFEMLKLLHSHNIEMFIYFRLNMPYERPETLELNIKMAAQILKMFPENAPAIHASDVPLDPMAPVQVTPDSYAYSFPSLSYEHYYEFSKGIIDLKLISSNETDELPQLRDYPEFDNLTKWDLLFVKKVVPRLWKRCYEFEDQMERLSGLIAI